MAEQALALYGELYEVEREVADLPTEERRRSRQAKAKPAADALHAWLLAHRQKVPPGSPTAEGDGLQPWALAGAGALHR